MCQSFREPLDRWEWTYTIIFKYGQQCSLQNQGLGSHSGNTSCHTRRGMQPKASKNDTKLSTIFKFLLPLFSIHWVVINLWLFSRGLTKLLWQLLLVFWSVCGGMRTWTSILCHITEITLNLYLYKDFLSADCELLEGRNLVALFFCLLCFDFCILPQWAVTLLNVFTCSCIS